MNRRRAVSRKEPSTGQPVDESSQRSASPYLLALENKGGSFCTGTAAVGTSGRSSVAGGAPSPTALPAAYDIHNKATSGQYRAATAARLQALIARANHVGSGSGRVGTGGGGGGSGAGGPPRPSSAMQVRRSVAASTAERQRSVSAMALREHLHRVSAASTAAAKKQQPAGAAAATDEQVHLASGLGGQAAMLDDAETEPGEQPGMAAARPSSAALTASAAAASAAALRQQQQQQQQQRAGSRLGRAPSGISCSSLDWGLATPPPMPAPPVMRPASAALRRSQQHSPRPRPQSPAQLPALQQHGSRPPSRMQQYVDGGAGGEGGLQQRLPSPLPPVRPFSASRHSAAVKGTLLRSKSMCAAGYGCSAGPAAADAAGLFRVTNEARVARQRQEQQEREQHQQQLLESSHAAAQAAAAAEREAEQLGQQLATAGTATELQPAVGSAAGWLTPQLQAPAADLLRQLVAAVALHSSSTSSSSRGDSLDGTTDDAAAGAAGSSSAAGGSGTTSTSTRGGGSSGSKAGEAKEGEASCGRGGGGQPPRSQQRPHQLFQQCNALRGEKAALERLNQDLSKQVVSYQQQLAALHLRLDNLLLDRQRLVEEAAEQAATMATAQAAAQSAAQAELAQLRQRLAAAQAECAAARGGGAGGAGGSSQAHGLGVGATEARRETQQPAAGTAASLSQVHPTDRISARSGMDSPGGRPIAEQVSEEEVSWGRSLTARAPAARPRNVPPVDLSRLRTVLPGRK